MLTRVLHAVAPQYFGVAGNQWRYALDSDYGFMSRHLAGLEFENHWVTIYRDNMVIKSGYAWDGCSPCFSILGLFYVGTPDGAQHLGVPATYHASLAHDALCQWRHEIGISKQATVAVFYELLVKVKFPLAGLYAAAVNRLGPQDFRPHRRMHDVR